LCFTPKISIKRSHLWIKVKWEESRILTYCSLIRPLNLEILDMKIYGQILTAFHLKLWIWCRFNRFWFKDVSKLESWIYCNHLNVKSLPWDVCVVSSVTSGLARSKSKSSFNGREMFWSSTRVVGFKPGYKRSLWRGVLMMSPLTSDPSRASILCATVITSN